MKITLVFSFLALMMIDAVLTDDDDTCDLEELEKCVNGFLRYFLNQFEKFKTDPEELEHTCETFKKNATCATSQPKYCKKRYPMLKNLLKAIEKYSDRFCKKSEKQKLYLEQAPCLRQHKESFQDCLKPEYKQTINNVTTYYGCHNLKQTIACINETGNKCGKKAEKLMEYLMEPFDVYPVFRTSQLGSWLNVFECIGWERAEADDSKVVCAFQNVKKCFKAIGNLGADLTVELPKTYKELHETCSGNLHKKLGDCLKDVVWTCNSDMGHVIDIRNDVERICTNGSVYQEAFLNSTECYNSYVPTTRNCHNKYASTKTSDAKALCYSAFKIKKCTNFLTNQCSKNITYSPHGSGLLVTQTLPAANLVHKYYIYADVLCEKYYKKFTSSGFAILNSNIWMSVVISILITIFKLNDYELPISG